MKGKRFPALIAALVLMFSCLTVVNVPLISAGETRTIAATDYTEQYRPQLSYTAASGWNNDPNGLIYVNGTYHMYYQYYPNGNRWGDMHWGHATSDDLVHWNEQEIAIYPNFDQNSPYPQGAIFSGSCVYADAVTAPTLFQPGESGFVAVFTQPDSSAGKGVYDQRQVLATSSDGTRFEANTFLEIIPNNDPDGVNEGDFRDPKVFRYRDKWIMAVGGGHIRIFTSENLVDWKLTQETGFWGECPDLFPLKVEESGEERWVMVMSPEDKQQSHDYNGTNRDDYYYPNEYYVIGTLSENFEFIPDSGAMLKPISFGIDSYAVQTFNDVPDGRRIGISWAASWKTVGDYALEHEGGLRENWNGGMTMAYELTLEKDGAGNLCLAKQPVKEYNALRKAALYQNETAELTDSNLLDGISGNLAEIDAEFDVAGKSGTIRLTVLKSDLEETVITYDIDRETLSFDRSGSSLSAKNTSRMTDIYSANVSPVNGRVSLRVFVDWGYVSVFANGGQASCISAVFPAFSSKGMSLTASQPLSAKVAVYALGSIWNNEAQAESSDLFYVSNRNLFLTKGSSEYVVASSSNPAFRNSNARYTVVSGEQNIRLTQGENATQITAVASGNAQIQAEYQGIKRVIDVQIADNGMQSQIEYSHRVYGNWNIGDGVQGEIWEDGKDAFLFSNAYAVDFTYEVTITSMDDDAQAAALVFRANENYTAYYCANYDFKDKKLKLWAAGIGDIESVEIDFRRDVPLRYQVVARGSNIRIYVNGSDLPIIDVEDETYLSGGRLGLNIYNGKFGFNDIKLTPIYANTDADVVTDFTAEGIVNIKNCVTGAYLGSDDFGSDEGKLTLYASYLKRLKSGDYTFEVIYLGGVKRTLTVGVENTGIEIVSAYNELVEGQSLEIELNLGGGNIERVLLDGREIAFLFDTDTGKLVIEADLLKGMSLNLHKLTVIADTGSVDFDFSLLDDGINEAAVAASKAISIIAAAFGGVCTVCIVLFWVLYRRYRMNREGGINV